ncbi:peptidoglycan D,D-transpeptidase FtsI family protein [Desulfobacter postgatei]|uniref:Cell division protein FtsI/penicillin-binding protein 2 n=1 Tax=Desulfobacter postgatei 2ac9 TaxID=879212 RepID=I5B3S5_9BACT|nr:penicillin-binding protein 2 [Desulfobacter postgatei]EIM64138.1 cell division protein FtsI/penicillin-binding protein 2 [Desulfobacter postgatei 2ac9]
MAANPCEKIGLRICFIRFFLLLCLAGIVIRSFDIQILQGKALKKKAENTYVRRITIQGDRGLILDRNSNKLGASTEAPDITADPTQIANVRQAAGQLVQIIGGSQAEIEKKLSQKRRFALLASRVAPHRADEVKKLNIVGIYIQDNSKRFYPNRSLAAQVIGFTGKDDHGLEGLEFSYNDFLEGLTLKTEEYRDGQGTVLDTGKKKRESLKGSTIVLTLDKKIQFFSEQALEQAVKEHRGTSGMALVMQPATGELLAVAHYPEFNPNNYGDFSRKRYRNRAVADPFEPGSIMKVITVAAAIERGMPATTIINCEKGRYRIGRSVIHDTHPYDYLTPSQIVKVSSNIGAAKIAQDVGPKAMYYYLNAFGFGTKTGINCSAESSGVLLPLNRWTNIDAVAMSFGQGMSVTALQLVSAVSAIANGGKLMKPMLVKKILSNSGEIIQDNKPCVIRQVISAKTAGIIKEMMSTVVEEDGTGTKAAIPGYRVCGKTSTAQKADKETKRYSHTKFTAAFAGFAPLDNPALAILVVVDEPRQNHYGGIVAAPAFKDIMARSFNYLNIPPQTDMVAALPREVSHEVE